MSRKVELIKELYNLYKKEFDKNGNPYPTWNTMLNAIINDIRKTIENM